jgi:hypothetical protein
MGWEPHVQSVLRGGVAFCTRCGGTAFNHAQVFVVESGLVEIDLGVNGKLRDILISRRKKIAN